MASEGVEGREYNGKRKYRCGTTRIGGSSIGGEREGLMAQAGHPWPINRRAQPGITGSQLAKYDGLINPSPSARAPPSTTSTIAVPFVPRRVLRTRRVRRATNIRCVCINMYAM